MICSIVSFIRSSIGSTVRWLGGQRYVILQDKLVAMDILSIYSCIIIRSVQWMNNNESMFGL